MRLTAVLTFLAAVFSFGHRVEFRAVAEHVFFPADFDGLCAAVAAEPVTGLFDWCARALASWGFSSSWGWCAMPAFVLAIDLLLAVALRAWPRLGGGLRPLPLAAFAVTCDAHIVNLWISRCPHLAYVLLVWVGAIAVLVGAVCGWWGRAQKKTVPNGWRSWWSAAAVLALAGVALGCVRPPSGLKGQLQMASAVFDGRWRDVLAVDFDKEDPYPLSRAYFTLALYRLDQCKGARARYGLPKDFYANEADELSMDGFLLLHHYGCVLPARRWAMEQAMQYGWNPMVLDCLGEIALLRGLTAEARKYYLELARMPFLRRKALRRLDEIARARRVNDFPDLIPLAEDNAMLDLYAKERGLIAFDNTQNVEGFVYALVRQYPRLTQRQLHLLDYFTEFRGK